MYRCSRCGKKVERGEKCGCFNRHNDYDRMRRDNGKTGFYQSAGWRAVRQAAKARAFGMDELMLERGMIVRGEIAHHIEPLEEAPDKALDMDNIVYVSQATHNRIHTEYEAGAERKEQMQERLRKVRFARGMAGNAV